MKPKDVSVFVGHGWARMSPEKAMPQKSCHFCHLIAFACVIRIGLHHHAGDNNAHSYCHFAPNCHFESLSCHCLVMSLGLSLDLSFDLSFNLYVLAGFVSFDLIHVTHLLIGRISACRRKRIWSGPWRACFFHLLASASFLEVGMLALDRGGLPGSVID